MYKALHLSPMVPSSNVRETASFLEKVLGFTIVRDEKNYIILIKDSVMVHIAGSEEKPDLMEFYLEVDGIDAFWNAIKDNVSGLKVKSPFDQAYGMREVHIQLPATNTIMFIGQAIT